MRPLLGFAALSLLALAPLGTAAGEPPPVLVDPELAKGNAAFACDLYGAASAGQGNVFLSPYSVTTAFAMLREGARGETAAQLDRVLHFPEGVGPKLKALVEVLTAPRFHTMRTREGEQQVSAYDLSVANGLWSRAGWAIDPAYGRRVADLYGAEFAALDFARQAAARATINRWVESKTKDKIRDLLPEGQPDPASFLVLANAVHFKAAWKDPFSAGLTKEEPFHAPGGDVRAPLMQDLDSRAYAETADVQILQLPYRYGDAAMLVVLPKAGKDLAAVEKGLSAAAVEGWSKALARRRVDVALPKFKYTVTLDLGKALQGLGLSLPFDAQKSDLSGIAKDPVLFVSAAIHKAFVAVDEEGTEAAAATAIGVTGSALPPEDEPVVFRADRPFLFLIRHSATNTILFLGRVTDPTKG